MKRLLILGASTIIGSAMSFSVLANPSVYGKANISLQDVTGFEDATGNNNPDSWKLNSNASRLGVKGKEEITGDLSAIYKLEYEAYFDDGENSDDNSFKQRNIYGGLQSKKYGTLIAGKFDTPLKVSQGKFDQFNDLELGDIKNALMGDNRPSNIVQYSTPKIFDGLVKLNAAFIPGEKDNTDRDEIADSTSFSIEVGDAKYKKHMFFASLAYDDEMESKWAGKAADDIGKPYMDTLRATAGVKLGDLKLAVIAQDSEESDAQGAFDEIEHRGYGVSGAYSIGKVTLKAQYLQSDIERDNADGTANTEEDIDAWSIGADYKLNKRTKAFAYYTKVESDADTLKDVKQADTDDDADTFGVGLEIKFGS